MTHPYTPGAADLAHIEQHGEQWTLVLVKDLRHPAATVWEALTDPAQLRAWAPFDASGNLGIAGAQVTLNTVGTPTPMLSETRVTRADPPTLLQYHWGDGELRWQLEAVDGGTRLILWHQIDRRYIAMGAAGWHLCLDALAHELGGTPIGRHVGPEMMKFEGWQRLRADYARQFGIADGATEPRA